MSSGGDNQPTRSVMFEMFEKALADGAITKEQREAFNIISREAKEMKTKKIETSPEFHTTRLKEILQIDEENAKALIGTIQKYQRHFQYYLQQRQKQQQAQQQQQQQQQQQSTAQPEMPMSRPPSSKSTVPESQPSNMQASTAVDASGETTESLSGYSSDSVGSSDAGIQARTPTKRPLAAIKKPDLLDTSSSAALAEIAVEDEDANDGGSAPSAKRMKPSESSDDVLNVTKRRAPAKGVKVGRKSMDAKKISNTESSSAGVDEVTMDSAGRRLLSSSKTTYSQWQGKRKNGDDSMMVTSEEKPHEHIDCGLLPLSEQEKKDGSYDGLVPSDNTSNTVIVNNEVVTSEEELEEINRSKKMLREDISVSNHKLFKQTYGEKALSDNAILNAPKFFKIAEEALRPRDCKIREEAATFLSAAVQYLVKNILDSSMQIYRQRNSNSACKIYSKILKTFVENNGAVTIENRLNVGLKFGPDVRAACLAESDESYRNVLNTSNALEQNLLKTMKEFDQHSSKSGRKSRAEPGLERFNDAWWTRDLDMQEEGRYTVEQIALSHFKLEVAYKNNVGPYAKSKKHPYHGDDQAILPRNQEGGDDCRTRWENQPCPIFDSESKILSRDDVLTVLKRMPTSRNCTGHTEMIENCILRAKLGVSLNEAAAANERLFEVSDDGDIDEED